MSIDIKALGSNLLDMYVAPYKAAKKIGEAAAASVKQGSIKPLQNEAKDQIKGFLVFQNNPLNIIKPAINVLGDLVDAAVSIPKAAPQENEPCDLIAPFTWRSIKATVVGPEPDPSIGNDIKKAPPK